MREVNGGSMTTRGQELANALDSLMADLLDTDPDPATGLRLRRTGHWEAWARFDANGVMMRLAASNELPHVAVEALAGVLKAWLAEGDHG